MKVQELINLVNDNNDKLFSIYDAEDYYVEDRCVAKNLNIDKHRWYTISTSVYKLEDGYVGITGVSSLNSEEMNYADCDVLCQAEEYEEVQITSYKPKEK